MTTSLSSRSTVRPASVAPPHEVRSQPPNTAAGPPGRTVAEQLEPLVQAFFPQGPPVRIDFWDGSSLGEENPAGHAVIRSPRALRYLLWSPGELGLGRAFVAGDMDLDGDIITLLDELEHSAVSHSMSLRALAAGVSAAVSLRAVGPPPPAPSVEARQTGWRHSLRRDRQAISHHYDVGNEFYGLFLGSSMTYSCARFVDPDMDLDAAQAAKHDLICRKLGLQRRPGMRLLDVGCGWGSLAMHAAQHYDARVVAVSISSEQVELARRRVRDAGLADRVDIRLQDYRELRGETFDAISSVGMFEHVGAARMPEYFAVLYDLLAPTGRLLNHAIASVGGSKLSSRSFVGRYVFPDGELIDIGDSILAMERVGFEVRDVESLREHYARTLVRWVRNLEQNWDQAVRLVGEQRARVWRLYMAASAVGFSDAGISIFQTLAVRNTPEGFSGMEPTRRDFEA